MICVKKKGFDLWLNAKVYIQFYFLIYSTNLSIIDTPSNEFFVPQDDWSLLSKLAIASISSQVCTLFIYTMYNVYCTKKELSSLHI